MSNTVEIRLKADGSDLIHTFRVSRDEAARLNRELGDSPAHAGRAGRSFADLNRSAGELARTMGRAGQAMSVALTLPMAAAAGAAAKLAIDAQETANKFDVVFGPAAERARAHLQALTDTVPLTRAQMEQLSSGIQDMLVPMGVARDSAADLSVNMVALAGDLASFNNVSPEEVLNAFQSALAGSSEPLRRFGVDVREARLEALALEQGLIDQGDAMTTAARAQAVLLAITQDSSDAQGDAARTAAGVANQIKFLQRDVRQLAEDLGQMLIPAVAEIVSAGRAGVAVLSDLDEETQRWALGAGAVVAATGPLLVGLSVLINSLRTVLPLIRRIASLKAAFATAVAGVTFAIVEGSRRFARYDANVAKYARTLETRATPAVERFSDAHLRMLNQMHELPTSIEALQAELASAEAQLRRFTRQYGDNSVAARSAADRVEHLRTELAQMGVATTEAGEASRDLSGLMDGILKAALNANRSAVQATQEAYADLQREATDFMTQIEDLAAELQGPVAAAFRQYNLDLETASVLHQQGALTTEQFGRAQEVLGQRLQSQVLPVMQDLMQKMLDIATFNFSGAGASGGSGSSAAELARGLSLAISGSQGANLGESIGNAIKTFGTAGIQEGLQEALTEAFNGMELGDAEMQVAFLAIGEAIGGNIGAAVGTAIGAGIGAALGGPLGMQIGAMIGNAVGGLFDREKDPILQTAGRFGFSRDPEEARRRGDITETELGEIFFRFRNVGDEAAGTLKRALRQFDGVMANIIGEEFIAEAQAALDGFKTESQDMGTIMQQRFEVIVGVLDDFTRDIALQGLTLEEQMQRVVDVFNIRARANLGDIAGTDDVDMVTWLASELARAGESIAESFQRLLDITTALDMATALTGNTISDSRAEVLRFSDALMKAFGDDLQRLTAGLDRIFQTFFSEEEILVQQAETARDRAADLLADLGLEVTEEMLTAEGFRKVFDDLFGTLTPEMTAILIEAGVAVSDLIDAQTSLNDLQRDSTEATEESTAASTAAARAERERAQTLRETMRDVNREIQRFAAPTLAAFADLNDAHLEQIRTLTDLGATEEHLRRVRHLHRLEMQREVGDLKMSILSLADDLLGVDRQFEDIGTSIVTATQNARDAAIRNLEQIDQWLARLSLSSVSPLTPLERRDEAEGNFRDAFAEIMDGNLQQLGDMPTLADAALSELASFYGTSNPIYRQLFEEIRGMMETVSGIDPPAEMRPPTFAQVNDIKTDASLFRKKLEELERMQKAWDLTEKINGLATLTGSTPAEIAKELGFTDADMRKVLGMVGADAGSKTGEELQVYFNDVIGGITGDTGTNALLAQSVSAEQRMETNLWYIGAVLVQILEALGRAFIQPTVDEDGRPQFSDSYSDASPANRLLETLVRATIWQTQTLEAGLAYVGDAVRQLVDQAGNYVNPGYSGPGPFRWDGPQYETGGPVPRTEPALVHAGEYVVPRNGALVSSDPKQTAILERMDTRLRNLERINAGGFGGMISEERRTRQTLTQRRETARA